MTVKFKSEFSVAIAAAVFSKEKGVSRSAGKKVWKSRAKYAGIPTQSHFSEEGYLLHSGNPNRLWFRFRLGFGVKNLIQGNRPDGHHLLYEAEEELATAL